MAINNKLGDSSQDSYVSISQANTYFDNRRDTTSWDDLSTANKEVVLKQAANDLGRFNFIEDKYYPNQGLAFPLESHDVVTGNCGTPFSTTSFRNTGLYSTTYGEMPTNFWKYGTIHITVGTAIRDIREIILSNVTNGSVTASTAYSATPTANSQFIAFEPIYEEVRHAQCEQALYILDNGNLSDLQGYKELGAESIKIGDAAITLVRGNMSRIALSPIARKLLSRWIKKSLRVARA